MKRYSVFCAALLLGSTFSLAQGRHLREQTPEQIARHKALELLFKQAEIARFDARHLLDTRSKNCEAAFLKAADLFAQIGDKQSATETEAELRFAQGDYKAVAMLLNALKSPPLHSDPALWLAIADCRLGQSASAIPLLKSWLGNEYCDTGKIRSADLPTATDLSAHSLESSARLILSYRLQSIGRPAIESYLAAQRLAPRNPTIANLLGEAYLEKGDCANARLNFALAKDSKNSDIRDSAGSGMRIASGQ